MLRQTLYLSLALFLFNCSRDDKTVRHGFWKYDNGFSIGDTGDILNFYADPYKISNDTIFLADTAKAIVIKTVDKTLTIKSISTEQTGKYIHFADSISIVQMDLTAPPPIEEPPVPLTPPKPNENKKTRLLKVTTIIMRADKDRMQKFISNPCDTFSIEFGGLYPIMDTLPNAFNDSLIMDNYLKILGFTVSSSGHGNWKSGPRIMTLELIKDDCKCTIFKKYYYNNKLSDGKYNLRVTEKVVCNAGNNAVE